MVFENGNNDAVSKSAKEKKTKTKLSKLIQMQIHKIFILFVLTNDIRKNLRTAPTKNFNFLPKAKGGIELYLLGSLSISLSYSVV